MHDNLAFTYSSNWKNPHRFLQRTGLQFLDWFSRDWNYMKLGQAGPLERPRRTSVPWCMSNGRKDSESRGSFKQSSKPNSSKLPLRASKPSIEDGIGPGGLWNLQKYLSSVQKENLLHGRICLKNTVVKRASENYLHSTHGEAPHANFMKENYKMQITAHMSSKLCNSHATMTGITDKAADIYIYANFHPQPTQHYVKYLLQ